MTNMYYIFSMSHPREIHTAYLKAHFLYQCGNSNLPGQLYLDKVRMRFKFRISCIAMVGHCQDEGLKGVSLQLLNSSVAPL